MITFSLSGVDETIESLSGLPSVIERRPPLEEVSREFAGVLKESTPKGYSGRLPSSVKADVDDDEAVVGYEAGVETAGNPKLDSVLRARRRGRSVLWVRAEDLESVMSGAVEQYSPTAVSVLEARFAEQLNGVS